MHTIVVGNTFTTSEKEALDLTIRHGAPCILLWQTRLLNLSIKVTELNP